MDTLRGKTAVVTGGGGYAAAKAAIWAAAHSLASEGTAPVTPAIVGDTVIRLATDPGAGEVSWRVTPDGPTALTSAIRVNPLV